MTLTEFIGHLSSGGPIGEFMNKYVMYFLRIDLESLSNTICSLTMMVLEIVLSIIEMFTHCLCFHFSYFKSVTKFAAFRKADDLAVYF